MQVIFAGVDVPYWDEWDGELVAVYQPWFEGRMSVWHLALPHNEHLLFFHRLFCLITVAVHGSWSPKLLMLIQSGIAALTAGILTLQCRWTMPKWSATLILTINLVCFASPYLYVNTLTSFQSTFVMSNLWMLLAFSLASKESLSVWYDIGLVVICVCALLTFGVGLLVPAALAVYFAYQLVTDRRAADAVRVIVYLVMTLLAFKLLPRVPHHDAIKAQSMSDYLWALAKYLSFPSRPFVGVGLLCFWLPLLWALLTGEFFKREKRFFALISVWSLGLLLASSYTRGGGGAGPASRYRDLFLMSWPWSLVWLQSFIDQSQNQERARLQAFWRAAMFMSLALIVPMSLSAVPELRKIRVQRKAMRRQVKGLVRLMENRPELGLQALKQSIPGENLPYPRWQRMAEILSDPKQRAILPEAVQPEPGRQAQRLQFLLSKAFAILLCLLSVPAARCVWLFERRARSSPAEA